MAGKPGMRLNAQDVLPNTTQTLRETLRETGWGRRGPARSLKREPTNGLIESPPRCGECQTQRFRTTPLTTTRSEPGIRAEVGHPKSASSQGFGIVAT